MPFLLEEKHKHLLNSHIEIWNKTNDLIKEDFDFKPAYSKKAHNN